MCGGISYLISDAPASGITALTASELSISPSGSISVWTDVVGTVGAHTVTVTAYLTSYSSVASTKSFSLIVSGNCQLTTITIGPTSVENFVTFAGYTIASLSTYSFNDTQSFSFTLPTDSTDFCGEKNLSFKVNSTETLSFLSALNQDFINFSPPTGTTLYGIG